MRTRPTISQNPYVVVYRTLAEVRGSLNAQTKPTKPLATGREIGDCRKVLDCGQDLKILQNLAIRQ